MQPRPGMTKPAIAGILLATLLMVAPAQPRAQDTPAAPPAPVFQPLPSSLSTDHELTLPDRTIRFSAKAGSIAINSAEHGTLGEAGITAFVVEGPPPAERPVTFALNGGPGAASAWLNVGAMGPWRLPLVPGAGTGLQPNEETWLDFTDLVFIDPPGTGYSRVHETASTAPQRGPRRGGIDRSADVGPVRQLWSVAGDVLALTNVIETWLKDNNRTASPRMLVGESYGGFRAPRIAQAMQRRKLAFDALILVSPVIDFDGRRSTAGLAHYVHVLPSIAAVELERTGIEPTRARLADVETYARSDYLLDLLQGQRDAAAQGRIGTRLSLHTRLNPGLIRTLNGKVSGFTYAREGFRALGRIASVYDASITGPDPGGQRRPEDPFLGAMNQPLTEAMVHLYHQRLNWVVNRSYELQSAQVNRSWIWPNSPNPPESISALAAVLGDDRLRVLVTHGFADLVTPYFASALQLAQLDFKGDESRVELKVYPGGHMFYSRDASRRAFRSDARRLLPERPALPAP